MIFGEEKLRQTFSNYDDGQYQPLGIDLKLERAELMSGDFMGICGIIDGEKKLPKYYELNLTDDGQYVLQHDQVYILDLGYMEIPKDTACFFWLRSTFARMGLFMSDAVGDAGFKGNIKVCVKPMLTDIVVNQGERVVQAVFFQATRSGEYDGSYQEPQISGGE